MLIRSTLAFATLALPLLAQEGDVKPAGGDAAAMFYQAYYLDNAMATSKDATAKAKELYTQFLASHADHKLAGTAAYRLLIIHYSSGDLEGARAFAKKHDKLISAVEAAERKEMEGRRAGGGGANREIATKLMQEMRDLDRDSPERGRILAAMRRVGGGFMGGMRGGFGGQGGRGQGGFGGRGQGGRGGRGQRGGMTVPKIADMKQEDAKKAVTEFVQRAERMIDALAQRGQGDKADKLEAQLDKLQDLVDGGKLADAQKILDELQK
ncbi:MAG: hypothetical protein KDC87_19920, partial [Planctomycetes bacterium]|nr:hypothetical protein [Planctomycetota bacterium]